MKKHVTADSGVGAGLPASFLGLNSSLASQLPQRASTPPCSRRNSLIINETGAIVARLFESRHFQPVIAPLFFSIAPTPVTAPAQTTG